MQARERSEPLYRDRITDHDDIRITVTAFRIPLDILEGKAKEQEDMATFIVFIPLIVKLMELAEVFISGKGSGAKKKELVTSTMKEVISTTKDMSTGGQKKTWEELEEPLGKFIDASASLMFGSDSIVNQKPSG